MGKGRAELPDGNTRHDRSEIVLSERHGACNTGNRYLSNDRQGECNKRISTLLRLFLPFYRRCFDQFKGLF